MNNDVFTTGEQVLAQLKSVAQTRLDALSDQELEQFTMQQAEIFRLAEANRSRAMVRLDERQFSNRCLGMRTEDWVSQTCQIPKKVALQQLRIGRELHEKFPLFEAALHQGTVTLDQATALVRAATPGNTAGLADNQDALIESTKLSTSFDQWTKGLRLMANTLEPTSNYDVAADLYANRLHYEILPDSTLGLDARLVGDGAELVRAAIDAEADHLYKKFVKENKNNAELEVPSRATLRGLALVELVRRANSVKPADRKTWTPRADVAVVVHAEDPCCAITTDSGLRIAKETTEALMCDSEWTNFILGKGNNPLNAGRKHRRATAAIRRALDLRDKGCVYPGCDAPTEWCDAHHIKHWEDQGVTCVCNMVLLCRYHHGVAHRLDWLLLPSRELLKKQATCNHPAHKADVKAATKLRSEEPIPIHRRSERRLTLGVTQTSSVHPQQLESSTADQLVHWVEWVTPSGRIIESQHRTHKELGPAALIEAS